MSTRVHWMLGVLVAVTLPTSAVASEGAIEINQASALAGGVTAGDTPGFPVTIGAPGRYVLTGSLTPSGADTGGIDVQSDDVTLDLNGFRIAGGTTCTGFGPTLVCTPQGSGIGIVSSGHEGITIRNGTITGFAAHGIELGARNCTIEGLTIATNGGRGLNLLGGCDVSGVIVDRNRIYGIAQSEVNGGEPDTTVRESVISRNGFSGIISFAISNDRFTLLRSVVHGNAGSGLDLSSQGSVNACVVFGNVNAGIRITEGDVRGNAVRSNGQGFAFGALVGYVHNSFSDHATASSGGVAIANHNLCFANPGPFSFCP